MTKPPLTIEGSTATHLALASTVCGTPLSGAPMISSSTLPASVSRSVTSERSSLRPNPVTESAVSRKVSKSFFIVLSPRPKKGDSEAPLFNYWCDYVIGPQVGAIPAAAYEFWGGNQRQDQKAKPLKRRGTEEAE